MDQKNQQNAYLAGGCFWGMQELVRGLKGVLATEVGYIGGEVKSPTYHDVKTGTSGHAEALKVLFDPQLLSFENLLYFFFKIHDPTTKNRQGNDIGSQYRSALFLVNEEQKIIAEKVIAHVDQSKAWGLPVITSLEKYTEFYPAEKEHQDYLQNYPQGYTCHFVRKVDFGPSPPQHKL